jgi:hypothetical protein
VGRAEVPETVPTASGAWRKRMISDCLKYRRASVNEG